MRALRLIPVSRRRPSLLSRAFARWHFTSIASEALPSLYLSLRHLTAHCSAPSRPPNPKPPYLVKCVGVQVDVSDGGFISAGAHQLLAEIAILVPSLLVSFVPLLDTAQRAMQPTSPRRSIHFPGSWHLLDGTDHNTALAALEFVLVPSHS
jgi:hypothetical protein